MGNESILIVDDHPTNVRLVRLLLTRAGYEDVRSAANSAETFQVLESFHPRLILMDIQLPGMDGLELTRRLRQRQDTQDMIVGALTAYAMEGARRTVKAER